MTRQIGLRNRKPGVRIPLAAQKKLDRLIASLGHGLATGKLSIADVRARLRGAA